MAKVPKKAGARKGKLFGKFHHIAPNLARAFLFFAIINVAMGVNFMLLNPTTDPFGIPKEWSGVAFLTVGLAQVIALITSRNLRLQRLMMATGVSTMSVWAGILGAATFTQQLTSLQLPIVCFGLAYLGLATLFTTPRKEST